MNTVYKTITVGSMFVTLMTFSLVFPEVTKLMLTFFGSYQLGSFAFDLTERMFDRA